MGQEGSWTRKAADETSLLDIYQAVECLGSTGQLFGFHENPNPNCPIGHNIHHVLDGKLEDIQTAMEKEMAQTSLKEVVEDAQKKNGPRIGFIRKKESGTEIGNSLEFDFVVPPPNSWVGL